MDYWLTVIGAIVGFGIYFLLANLYDTRKAPPGPWGLPFIGLLITLNKENSLWKIREYKKKYGNIISFRVGNKTVVVLNDYKLIQEAMKRDEFLGRPDNETWEVRNGGFKNRGVLFTDGVKSWQELRRFTLKNLREFGVGKGSMEGMLLHEVDELLKILKKNSGKAFNLKNNLNCSVFNSLWTILTCQRFDLEDEKFQEIMKSFTGFLDRLTLFSPANYFVWPAKYGLVGGHLWQSMITIRDTMYALMDELIQEHLDSYQEGVVRDYIDAYIAQHKSASKDSSFYSEEGLRNLRITLMDLFVAGTETSATTLTWACLYLGKYPRVQKKLHDELDRVIGRNVVTREDKIKLPYLEAFISEVHRRASIVPMSVYHKTLRDCEFAGYHLKKGTNVYVNLFEAHHDPEFWGDPEEFRPERFLDATGTKYVSKEALMPFSTGRRICLGENLARDTLYYFMASILQNFTIQLDPASADVDIVTPKPNFIKAPYDFQVILETR